MSYNLSDAIADTLSIYKSYAGPVQLTEVDCYANLHYRKSNCMAMDWVMANHSVNGGLAGGRIVEMFGPESCGKTTYCIVAAAKVQRYKKRNKVLFLDYEHKLNLPYAISMGMNEELTYFEQPSGEDAGPYGLQLLINATNAEDVGLIIVDSIAAVLSKEEMMGELTDANVGASARLWSKAIRKIANKGNPDAPPVILINQLRANIGGYGSTETTAGARAIKFFSAVRIDIRAGTKITDKFKNSIGQLTTIKAVKNQCGRPYLKEETDLYFGEGYDNVKWLVKKAVALKVLNKGGAIYSFGKHKFKKTSMYEYMTDKIQQELYNLCVAANNSRVEEASRTRKANPSKRRHYKLDDQLTAKEYLEKEYEKRPSAQLNSDDDF